MTLTPHDLLKLPASDAVIYIVATIKAGRQPMDLGPDAGLSDCQLGELEALWDAAGEQLAQEAKALRLHPAEVAGLLNLGDDDA